MQQVIQAYGSAPGYGWHPRTEDPDYLRIEHPRMDFVALAKAFGNHPGEIVRHPGEVGAAIRRGIDAVLTAHKTYILDMRTAQETPQPPAAPAAAHQAFMARLLEPYISQPPIDFYHTEAAPVQAMARLAGPAPQIDIPIIF